MVTPVCCLFILESSIMIVMSRFTTAMPFDATPRPSLPFARPRVSIAPPPRVAPLSLRRIGQTWRPSRVRCLAGFDEVPGESAVEIGPRLARFRPMPDRWPVSAEIGLESTKAQIRPIWGNLGWLPPRSLEKRPSLGQFRPSLEYRQISARFGTILMDLGQASAEFGQIWADILQR